MTQESKHEIVEFKASDPEGLFVAKVSAFGNKDRNGDIIMQGAWDRTVEVWKTSGKNIPVVWSHDHKNPDAFIGYVNPNDIRITGDSVIMAGKLDVKGNPLAMRAFDLLKDGLVSNWSFSYGVNREERGKDGSRQIWDLDVFEVGPTLVGANAKTDTLSTKEAAVLEAPEVPTPETEAVVTWHDGAKTFTVPLGLPTVTTMSPPNVTMSTEEPATAEVEAKLGVFVDDAVRELDRQLDVLIEEKIGRVISRKTEERIRRAVTELSELLSVLDREDQETEGSPSEEKAAEQAAPPSETELRRRQLDRMGLFLKERGRG